MLLVPKFLAHVHLKNQSVQHIEYACRFLEKKKFPPSIENDIPQMPTKKSEGRL
jgi:hypothetical protein